jgi:hypothetical protein
LGNRDLKTMVLWSPTHSKQTIYHILHNLGSSSSSLDVFFTEGDEDVLVAENIPHEVAGVQSLFLFFSRFRVHGSLGD